jgi:hypothetical protein
MAGATWDIHIYNPKTGTATTKIERVPDTTASMGDAPAVNAWASKKYGIAMKYVLSVPHGGSAPFGTSARALKAKGYDYWKRQATIESGHFDNLVYDDGNFRVWVSRQSLADYDGDRKAWMADRLTVEKKTAGRWVKA